MTVYSVLSDQVDVPISDFVVTEEPEKALANAEVVIDFSAPSACSSTYRCVEKRIPYLLPQRGCPMPSKELSTAHLPVSR